MYLLRERTLWAVADWRLERESGEVDSEKSQSIQRDPESHSEITDNFHPGGDDGYSSIWYRYSADGQPQDESGI